MEKRAVLKNYGLLGAMLDLGRGSGPMNHMFDLKSIYCTEKAD